MEFRDFVVLCVFLRFCNFCVNYLAEYLVLREIYPRFVVPLPKGMFFIGRCRVEFHSSALFLFGFMRFMHDFAGYFRVKTRQPACVASPQVVRTGVLSTRRQLPA